MYVYAHFGETCIHAHQCCRGGPVYRYVYKYISIFIHVRLQRKPVCGHPSGGAYVSLCMYIYIDMYMYVDTRLDVDMRSRICAVT